MIEWQGAIAAVASFARGGRRLSSSGNMSAAGTWWWRNARPLHISVLSSGHGGCPPFPCQPTSKVGSRASRVRGGNPCGQCRRGRRCGSCAGRRTSSQAICCFFWHGGQAPIQACGSGGQGFACVWRGKRHGAWPCPRDAHVSGDWHQSDCSCNSSCSLYFSLQMEVPCT
jgi:hypothetical protein